MRADNRFGSEAERHGVPFPPVLTQWEQRAGPADAGPPLPPFSSGGAGWSQPSGGTTLAGLDLPDDTGIAPPRFDAALSEPMSAEPAEDEAWRGPSSAGEPSFDEQEEAALAEDEIWTDPWNATAEEGFVAAAQEVNERGADDEEDYGSIWVPEVPQYAEPESDARPAEEAEIAGTGAGDEAIGGAWNPPAGEIAETAGAESDPFAGAWEPPAAEFAVTEGGAEAERNDEFDVAGADDDVDEAALMQAGPWYTPGAGGDEEPEPDADEWDPGASYARDRDQRQDARESEEEDEAWGATVWSAAADAVAGETEVEASPFAAGAAGPGDAAHRLADRLELLAAELRTHGETALHSRLTRGERLDALLAAVLAGYLAGEHAGEHAGEGSDRADRSEGEQGNDVDPGGQGDDAE